MDELNQIRLTFCIILHKNKNTNTIQTKTYLLPDVIRQQSLFNLRRDDLGVQILREGGHFIHAGRYVLMHAPEGALVLRHGTVGYPMRAMVRLLQVVGVLKTDGVMWGDSWRCQKHRRRRRLRIVLVLGRTQLEGGREEALGLLHFVQETRGFAEHFWGWGHWFIEDCAATWKGKIFLKFFLKQKKKIKTKEKEEKKEKKKEKKEKIQEG